MGDVNGSLEDMQRAFRLIMAASRKQIATIAAIQIALLSVIEQLVNSDLIDANVAAGRMRELVAELPAMDEIPLSDEVASFADRVASVSPVEISAPPTTPRRTKPRLVK